MKVEFVEGWNKGLNNQKNKEQTIKAQIKEQMIKTQIKEKLQGLESNTDIFEILLKHQREGMLPSYGGFSEIKVLNFEENKLKVKLITDKFYFKEDIILNLKININLNNTHNGRQRTRSCPPASKPMKIPLRHTLTRGFTEKRDAQKEQTLKVVHSPKSAGDLRRAFLGKLGFTRSG